MNRGLALTTILIIIAVILAVGISGAFIFLNKDAVPQEITVEEDLPRALEAKLGRQIEYTITEEASRYIRGETAEGDFYAVNTGYGWRVVEVSFEPLSCERLRALTFPESFLTDCVTTFPTAQTVSDVKTNSSSGDKVTVIGILNVPNDPSQNIVISATDESGDEISIVLDGDVDSSTVDDGETVVVSGTVGDDNTVIADTITDPTTEEDDQIEEELDSSSDSDEDSDSSDSSESDTDSDEEITEPGTSPPPAFILDLFDIDNSGIEIQLEQ